MNPLMEIIKAFTSGWLWTVVLAITAAFMWALNDALGKQLNRDQLDRLLDGRRYAVLYHGLLQTALARVDRWLTPRIGPSDEAREAEGRRAWSWPLLDLSLRLAVAYPLLTLVVAWSVLGTDGKLGSLVVLPAAGWGFRAGALAGLVLVFWLTERRFRAATQGKRYRAFAYSALATAVAVGGAFGGALAGVGAFAVAVAVAAAFAVASAFAFPLPFPRAAVFAGALADAIRRGFSRSLAYAGLVTFLLAALLLAARHSPGIGEAGATLILFLGVLPLLNAVLDFLSIGLTRFLLRRGAVSGGFGALGWALGDLFSALGFFALLGLALLTMVQWLNALGAAPLLDLAALFADLRADPGAYWWLYVTIFSTLLPTLLHLVLACFSALLAVMPEGAALFIRRQLPLVEADAMAKAAAFWSLSTIGFMAIAAVAFGLYGLVSGVLAVFPYLGDWYLYGFELYAAWLKAPVVPVRPGWL